MDTHNYRKALENEKASLIERLRAISTPNPANPEDWDAKTTEEETAETADLNLAADVHEEEEVRHATSDALETRLQHINDAFERIEKGTYGVCEVCNKEIEPERLDANPAATTCIEHTG